MITTREAGKLTSSAKRLRSGVSTARSSSRVLPTKQTLTQELLLEVLLARLRWREVSFISGHSLFHAAFGVSRQLSPFLRNSNDKNSLLRQI